jgi:hypothetical protein
VNRTQGSVVIVEEAIAAAEFMAAETAYRFQLAREMAQPGYARAEADMAGRWSRGAGPGWPIPDSRSAGGGPGGRAHFADRVLGILPL